MISSAGATTDRQPEGSQQEYEAWHAQSGSRFGEESTHKYVCTHRRTSYTRQRSLAPPSFALPHYKLSSHLRATDDQGPCFPTQHRIIHSSDMRINPGKSLIHKNKKKKRVPHTHEVPSSILGLSTCFVLFRFVLLLQYTTLKGVVSYNSS